MYYVYILYSEDKTRFYVGQTSDLSLRLSRHNMGLVKSSKYGLPWKLVYSIEVTSREAAVALERKIKKRGAKRHLIDNSIGM